MQTTVDIRELQERIERESSFVDALTMGMNQVIVGQKHLVESLLIGLLADGHILLEGVPGLAKTLAINTLAKLVKADFSRIQFTPDLLPADLLGTQIYSQKTEEFKVKQGPIFANFVLADEINRAPAKVQSALLEAMQERQITIGEQTYKLDEPFLVLATQNPIEQEGTYPLPEAQTDRFMLKVVIGYPKKEEEMQIIRQNITGEKVVVNSILATEDIIKARKIVREVYLDEKIEKYIVDIVFATRQPEAYGLDDLKAMIAFGGSPRASINLALAARAYAFIHRRGYVIPEDVRAVCYDVLRHRIGLTYEAEANNITTEERPLGLYHPAPKLHHIKKENIGLIEVMGLAVLPARLSGELALLEKAILSGESIRDNPTISHHADWAERVKSDHPELNKANARAILEMEIGKVFMQVLLDAGVFKRTHEGKTAFMRFINVL